jgi:hypothetical protein
MPSLDQTFLNNITCIDLTVRNKKIKYPVFVETGTGNGHTTFQMESFFETLYTVEVKKEFYENVVNSYSGSKIHFLLGDSAILLEFLCQKIDDNVVFFLDGHYSSCGTGKGLKDVPLYEELNHINTHFKRNGIIIIDDARLFGSKGGEDWSDVNEEDLLKVLGDRVVKSYRLGSDIDPKDRLIIHLSEKI